MNRLRTIRERKGFTLSQLAGKAGVSARVLADYEEGRTTIPLAHAKLIAKALWVEIEDLLPPPGAAPLPPAPAMPPRPPEPREQPAPRQHVPSQTAVAAAPPPSYSRPAPAHERPGEGPGQGQGFPRHGARPQPHEREGMRQRPGGVAPHEARPPRPAPAPPSPVTEGQMQELLHLASRLQITQEQLEERLGKPVNTLTRPEAKDWVKRLRGMADEIAPSSKVRFGSWPDAQQDREAAYLAQQRDAATHFNFKLFNGEHFSGTIADFTPYTITIRDASTGEDIVLRKLAIAYYRQVGSGSESPEHATASPVMVAHSHPMEGTGIGSNHIGEPAVPETDNMDEDRGV